MREVTHAEYREFLKTHDHVIIEDVEVALSKKHEIKEFAPKEFKCAKCDIKYHRIPPNKKCECGGEKFIQTDYEGETTTVWSFPDRGSWATHLGNYRGNWSPYIPHNLIKRYAKEGDLVLDQMVGSGTTLVECKLLRCRSIGVDINPDAIMVTRNRLDFTPPYKDKEPEIKTYVGDARNLNLIEDESIDLIATHPPYASIIPYSRQRVEGDLSSVHDIAEFAEEMRKAAEESYRVLKPGKHCAILMGDTRRHKHFVPITPRVLQSFLDAGFILREDIIKMQWKMKSTRERWRGKGYDFLLIAHEHLYVFRKPEKDEKMSQFKESVKWG
ncbi:MAG: methyltransferase domain-containing protein [Hadesarchaea archaeon]|nr:methyltransferase domain-containing protein [Hadesarchaea archaeon]